MSVAQYYTLGRSGLRVSPLALGTMTFGTEWGWGSEKNTAREIFARYVDAGGNLIDTADVYTKGSSETWLGEFMDGNRDKLVLATSTPWSSATLSPNSPGSPPSMAWASWLDARGTVMFAHIGTALP